MKEIIGVGASGVDVRMVQEACNAVGCPVEVDGDYGPLTAAAVRCFQDKTHLVVDGKVGPITWAKMKPDYAARETDRRNRTTDFKEALIQEAITHIGLRENGKNRHPTIDRWSKYLGLPNGLAWCMIAVQGIFYDTAKKRKVPDPLKPDTGGVMDFWNSCPKEWKHGPSDGMRGDIFIMDMGRGLGHTGLVAGYRGGVYLTLEGNTDASKSREGDGFYSSTRKYSDPRLIGFVRVPV